MEVWQLVGVRAVVDLCWPEGRFDRSGRPGYVAHKGDKLWFGKFEEFVDVSAIGNHAASGVGLLLEQKKSGGGKRRDLDHEIVQSLIFATIETVGDFTHLE